MPTAGTITTYLSPGGPGVRLDSIAYAGYTIPTSYDSMIGKLIVWSLDWEGAVKKAKRALDEFIIEGFPTNIPLHQQIARDADFRAGKFTTNYLDERMGLFKMESQKSIKEEDQRMSDMRKFIDNLEKNNIKPRY